MNPLAELLPLAAIRLDVRILDWQSAVMESGRLLTTSGATTSAYTEDILAAINRFGPYIVNAPGFALAHAQASESVIRTGLSWLRLAEPVAFGHDANSLVTLVVGLASKDHDEQMAALQELATLISDPSNVYELAAASSPAELLAVINGGSNRGTR
jgi:ascorbate PTS system EIIA or EIIAB component